jgi:hypothetical protein
MQHQTAKRRRGVVWATSVATTSVAALALAGTASAVTIEQYVEVPNCQPATSQKCPQIPEVNFTASDDGSVLAQFTANSNHCSDIIVDILLDHYQQWQSARVGPGQTVTLGKGFYVTRGNHVLGVRAEGILGGCNTGVLNAWGGTVRVDSMIDPNKLREGRSPFDPPPLEEAGP